MNHRLHLRFFALIKSVASLVAVGVLLALSKPLLPHQKHTESLYGRRCSSAISMLLVEKVGVEPTSRTPLVVSLQPLSVEQLLLCLLVQTLQLFLKMFLILFICHVMQTSTETAWASPAFALLLITYH